MCISAADSGCNMASVYAHRTSICMLEYASSNFVCFNLKSMHLSIGNCMIADLMIGGVVADGLWFGYW